VTAVHTQPGQPSVVTVDAGEPGSTESIPVENRNIESRNIESRHIEIRADVVVNATGVWTDDVRALASGEHPDSIRPAKGVHITVPWHTVGNDIAVIIPVPKDRRSLFVIPWEPLPDGTFRHAYVGTTDTDYQGDVDDPRCTADDVAYVLAALNASVTTAITEADITGVWAGLRPLVKSAPDGRTADLSRRHSITVDDSGVISVAGGKLTTYRDMAEDTVDRVLKQLDRRARCVTAKLGLLGAEGYREPAPEQRRLAHRYGTLRVELDALVATDPSLAEPLVPGLGYIRAEAVYAVRNEMALTLDDVLSRRTRARLADRDAAVA
ncbi:MAG TPA: FAD-dependent oxidoreductase, partial [Ilumatobacteraceae bacterium]|nr:FAD-dependent oxidoreductase [Ilumatobacteraceae bacterium]